MPARCTSPPRSARASRTARATAVARAHLVLTCGGTTRGPLPAAPRSSFKPWASSRRRRRRPSHLAGRRYLRRHRRHLSRSRRHRCHPCRRRRRRAHRRHLRRVRRLCHHTRQLSAPANRTRRQPHYCLHACPFFHSASSCAERALTTRTTRVVVATHTGVLQSRWPRPPPPMAYTRSHQARFPASWPTVT